MRKFSFLIVIMLLLVSACSEELFQSEKDYDDHYLFGDDIRSSVLGLYSGLQDVQEQLIVLNEVRGELVETTDNAPADIKAIEKLEYSKDNKWLSPTPIYNVIINCNDILSKINEVKENDAAFSDDDFALYYGEVLTIRTWCYYQLYTLYDKVPYHEQSVTSPNSIVLSDVMLLDTLDAQLDSALQLYYSIENEVFTPKQFNKYSALVLQGEINIARKNYLKAYNSLIQVIAHSSHFKLGSEYANEKWIDLYSSDESSSAKEIITWIDFSIVNNQQHNLQAYFSSGKGGLYWFKPTAVSMNKWSSQVKSNGAIGDEFRGEGVSYRYQNYVPVVNKYNIDRDYFDGDMNLVVYRASYAALLFAEAANWNSSPGIAAMVINNGIGDNGVRSRVDLENVGQGIMDPIQLDSIILNEMALELAFEGRRFADLSRYFDRYDDKTIIANKIASKFTDPIAQEEMRNKILNLENLRIPYMW